MSPSSGGVPAAISQGLNCLELLLSQSQEYFGVLSSAMQRGLSRRGVGRRASPQDKHQRPGTEVSRICRLEITTSTALCLEPLRSMLKLSPAISRGRLTKSCASTTKALLPSQFFVFRARFLRNSVASRTGLAADRPPLSRESTPSVIYIGRSAQRRGAHTPPMHSPKRIMPGGVICAFAIQRPMARARVPITGRRPSFGGTGTSQPLTQPAGRHPPHAKRQRITQ